jgi:hypothetical protein
MCSPFNDTGFGFGFAAIHSSSVIAILRFSFIQDDIPEAIYFTIG